MSLIQAAIGLLFGSSAPAMTDEDLNRRWQRDQARVTALARGWRPWVHDYMTSAFPQAPSPYDYARVWIWRPEWFYPQAVNTGELNPLMNVSGLFWKPWRASEDKPIDDRRKISP